MLCVAFEEPVMTCPPVTEVDTLSRSVSVKLW